uniref:MOSC domain-containing protein n=1 Tax=Caenorhabditis japonica TaxID=281687 RepID=A0A8R1E273_CAEJA
MLEQLDKDKKVLIGCMASSFIFYHTARQLYAYLSARNQEWIPIGVVKSLHIYPMKSCKSVDLFAFKCTKLGPVMGDMEDRAFLLVDGKTGKFITARQKPRLVHVECHVEDGILTIAAPGKQKVSVDLRKVVENGKLIRASLFDNLKQDGYDCGDEVSQVLSEYIEEPDYRLIFYKEGLYTERTCIPDDDWWNTPVPKRKDDVSSRNFRPSILIEGTAPWDEDKWAEVKIGDAVLECFSPCTRCVLTTVDPEKGEMSKENEPLRKLREFRLAPEGKMRKAHKDSPVFGVYAGLKHEAYIHVGQTAYVRYKAEVF